MAFEGVYSVLPTPFTDSGELDESSLRRVVDLFVAAGVNGLTALGVTGEVARLEEPERARIIEVVVDQAAGRVRVVAGTTAEGTRTCSAYSRQAKELGAAAVMVSPPRMPKLNSDAVVRHYKALADAVSMPIVVQDYPPISGFVSRKRSRPRARSSSRIRRRRSRRRASSNMPRERRFRFSGASAACSCSRNSSRARRAP